MEQIDLQVNIEELNLIIASLDACSPSAGVSPTLRLLRKICREHDMQLNPERTRELRTTAHAEFISH